MKQTRVKQNSRVKPAAPPRHETALQKIVKKSTADPRRDVKQVKGRSAE